MRLTNTQLQNFVDRIKLKRENMPKYRDQFDNLISKLEKKIKEDEGTELRVTRVLQAGSWKKGTILRPTGEKPIDIDLVFFIEGDESVKDDVGKLHDFVITYLEDIYPMKNIYKDVDAEGNTKSVKIKFSGTGLEIDIVPVVPIKSPIGYVWQPERGGGGNYTTSIDGQLEFARERRNGNSNITGIIRALKWWRNYKELDEFFSSFSIELIESHLELKKGVEANLEEGIIRFFDFVSSGKIKEISFQSAINSVSNYQSPIFIGDPTNNENNIAKKLDNSKWDEVVSEALEAFETLNIAQSVSSEGGTVEEWKSVFGPNFNINKEDS